MGLPEIQTQGTLHTLSGGMNHHISLTSHNDESMDIGNRDMLKICPRDPLSAIQSCTRIRFVRPSSDGRFGHRNTWVRLSPSI